MQSLNIAFFFIFLNLPSFYEAVSRSRTTTAAWTYTCVEGYCIKNPLQTDQNNDLVVDDGGIGLMNCKLTCGEASIIWPKPQKYELSKTVQSFKPINPIIDFNGPDDGKSHAWLQELVDEKLELLQQEGTSNNPSEDPKLTIDLSWSNDESTTLKRTTNESYDLFIHSGPSILIHASDYFGLRHGLETLFQLMAFDDVLQKFIILQEATIFDSPAFQHRGVLLDSARNFMPIKTIKNVIDGMSYTKLNVLHWHITDTQSFPVALENDPITSKMVEFGAYSSDKVFNKTEIIELVTYATKKGVRIIPEFDAPAHVGSGWQGPELEKYTVCFEKRPWYDFCVQPPCGQLNPMVPGLDNIIKIIYGEFYELFNFDSFHYGGDEVDFRCWGSEKSVTDPMTEEGLSLNEAGFVTIWERFQNNASELIKQLKPDVEHILWTSTLTKAEHIDKLENEYTIQIWTDSKDSQIDTVIKSKHKLLFSNVDALYMDCGFSTHVGDGLNWCSPYKSWQTVYDNDLHQILESHGGTIEDRKRITGAEVALWTETVSGKSFEVKLFPRASAHGERLWSNPSTTHVDAQRRLVDHTYRLLQRGIATDAVQPEYCRLNEGRCYVEVPDEPNQGSFLRNSYEVWSLLFLVKVLFVI